MTNAPLPPEAASKPQSRLFLAACAAGCLIFCLVAGGAAYLYALPFEEKIPPNTFIGVVDVSGTDAETARERVQKRVDELLSAGVSAQLGDQVMNIPLSTSSGADTVEDATFDIDTAIAAALAKGRDPNPAIRTIRILKAAVSRTDVPIPVMLSEDRIAKSIQYAFPDAEQPITDAQFLFEKTKEGWTGRIQGEKPGTSFDLPPFFTEVENSLSRLEGGVQHVSLISVKPDISQSLAREALPVALAALEREPLQLLFVDEENEEHRWAIQAEQLSTILKPSVEEFPLEIDLEALEPVLKPIAEEIERPAVNARFQIENGRVKEFEQSVSGLAVDREALKLSLEAALQETKTDVGLVLKVTEPDITTEEVNDLGITEILGIGTSNYRNSPYNRILNIKNGVRLLNGILIPPGETFSLIAALKPFTPANGYLPELVIKGDRIEPELGGGLCQIGTTTFRATMNSGLPILERRNHSLVVSYYNDPVNNNPGTDATIYEPAPDFKFVNDTGHHILFQAEVLENLRQLRFTFWGTSDGRKGSYSAPVVTRWIPAGEPREIPSKDLAPGETKCQEAHVGADATFTYTIERPDGTKEETVYASHYRPLPKLCLVSAPPETTGEQTDAASVEISNAVPETIMP